MAYQEVTGLATPEALIDAICDFVSANGWTVHRSDLASGLRTATVSKAGTTDYVHIYNPNATEVYMRVSVGYDGGLAPSANPNVQAFDSRTNGLVGPYSRVYFFMDEDEEAVHIVVATSMADEYRHFCFGLLEKIGTYDGGTYAEGSYRSTTFLGDMDGIRHHVPFYGGASGVINNSAPYQGAVRADVTADARSNFYHWFGDGPPHATFGRARTGITVWSNVSSDGWLGLLAGGADRNLFSGRSIAHPIHVFVDRTGSTTYRSPIGTVKNTRYCNLAKLAVGEEISIGADVWKVFPFFKRSLTVASGAAAADLGSHTGGYAIKKVP